MPTLWTSWQREKCGTYGRHMRLVRTEPVGCGGKLPIDNDLPLLKSAYLE